MFLLNNELLAPIQFIKGVGPKISLMFAKKEVTTIADSLYFFPRTYEDRREIKKICDLEVGKKEIFVASVLSIEELYTRNSRKKLLVVKASDDTGSVNLKWFHAHSYMKKRFKRGQTILITGSVNLWGMEFDVTHPEVEILAEEEGQEGTAKIDISTLKGIVPIYSETEGLTQRLIRKIITRVIDEKINFVEEFLPDGVLKKFKMMDLRSAIISLHRPNESEFDRLLSFNSRGHLRLIFNEFFALEIIMSKRRLNQKQEIGLAFKYSGALKKQILESLPFALTGAQIKTLEEIEKDLRDNCPMNRLLQGDVGSGKTLVAMLSAACVIEDSYQAVLMVPTEILATQHYNTALKLFSPLGIKVGLLVSGIKGAQKKVIYEEIKTGQLQLIIGTHALIQEEVAFKKLGLAIIDEQQQSCCLYC